MRKHLMSQLRATGFKRTYRDNSCVIYTRTYDNRVVEVQLWWDEKHRVSHMLNGVMNTYPTPFTDVESMLAAIKHEVIRTDHPPRLEHGIALLPNGSLQEF